MTFRATSQAGQQWQAAANRQACYASDPEHLHTGSMPVAWRLLALGWLAIFLDHANLDKDLAS